MYNLYMRVKILASSSSGNCALIQTGDKNFLIDAGISFKRLEEGLFSEGIRSCDIDAIFITHAHSDHVSGLNAFSVMGVPIYATAGTASSVITRKELKWTLIPSFAKFQVNGINIESFPIPHDCVDPIGFVFDDGEDRLVWALDVGYLDSKIKSILKSASILVLESNYCPKMLEADKRRPFSLKQRIRGRHGHLSNDETYQFLLEEKSPSWKQIYLAHVSRNCNSVEKLEALYSSCGMPIEVVDPWGEAVSA